MTTPHDPVAEFSQPGGNPTAPEGLPPEEDLDQADVEDRLDDDPDGQENQAELED